MPWCREPETVAEPERRPPLPERAWREAWDNLSHPRGCLGRELDESESALAIVDELPGEAVRGRRDAQHAPPSDVGEPRSPPGKIDALAHGCHSRSLLGRDEDRPDGRPGPTPDAERKTDEEPRRRRPVEADETFEEKDLVREEPARVADVGRDHAVDDGTVARRGVRSDADDLPVGEELARIRVEPRGIPDPPSSLVGVVALGVQVTSQPNCTIAMSPGRSARRSRRATSASCAAPTRSPGPSPSAERSNFT